MSNTVAAAAMIKPIFASTFTSSPIVLKKYGRIVRIVKQRIYFKNVGHAKKNFIGSTWAVADLSNENSLNHRSNG